MLLPAIALLLLAPISPVRQSPKQAQDYAKLQSETAAARGVKQAEDLAKMAELEFDFARQAFVSGKPGDAGVTQLNLATQHADQAMANLRAEAALGHKNGMKNVESSLQRIGFGLKDLAQQVRFEDRPKVEAARDHISDLRAELLQMIFAPKPKKPEAEPRLMPIGFVFHRQQQRDPLTPVEADRIRDTAGSLDQRVAVLLQFAQARLTQFDKVRNASPRPPDRETKLYELLRQYNAILPEAEDALDDVLSGGGTSATSSDSAVKKYNVPKVLKATLASLSRLSADLQRIQSSSTPADLATYHFVLDDCLSITNDFLQDAGQAKPNGN
ncbi:MAG TPA: hypothetical protein VN709_09015 [Terriglobales bacterium]|nr:hypothetical protein [Terriglobales bacterium]